MRKFKTPCSRKARQRHKRVYTDFMAMLRENGIWLNPKSPYISRLYSTETHEYLPVYQETVIKTKARVTQEELNKLKLHIQEYRLDCTVLTNPLLCLVSRKNDGYLKSYIKIFLKLQG